MKKLAVSKDYQLVNHLSNNLYDVYDNDGLVRIVDRVNDIEYYSTLRELESKSIDQVVEERLQDYI